MAEDRANEMLPRFDEADEVSPPDAMPLRAAATQSKNCSPDWFGDSFHFDGEKGPRLPAAGEAEETEGDKADNRRQQIFAFEICEPSKKTTRGRAMTELSDNDYTFRRRGNSLSFAMGLNAVQGDWNHEIASSYTRCTDWDATLLLLATTLGPTAFTLSSSLAVSGLIPAFGLILCMAAAYLFLILRLIDVPRLVGENMETCHDIVQVFFTRFWYRISCVVIVIRILSFCGAIFIGAEHWTGELLDTISMHCGCVWDNSMKALVCPDGQLSLRKLYEWPTRLLLVGFLLYSSTFWSSPRSVRLNAKLGTAATVLALVLVSLCVLWKAIFYPNMEPAQRELIGDTSVNTWITNMRKTNHAFCGISFIPHIVGDMQQPSHAPKVFTKAVCLLALYYGLAFLVGFLAFGSTGSAKRGLMQKMYDDPRIRDSYYLWITWALVKICFITRCLTSFTIILWPLSREIHRIIGMDRFPAVEAGLPWAVRQNQQHKLWLRMILVVFSSLLFSPFQGAVTRMLGRVHTAVLLGAPHPMVEYLIIPVCIVLALVVARRRARQPDEKPHAEALCSTDAGSGFLERDTSINSDNVFGITEIQFMFIIFVLLCSVLVGNLAFAAGFVQSLLGY